MTRGKDEALVATDAGDRAILDEAASTMPTSGPSEASTASRDETGIRPGEASHDDAGQPATEPQALDAQSPDPSVSGPTDDDVQDSGRVPADSSDADADADADADVDDTDADDADVDDTDADDADAASLRPAPRSARRTAPAVGVALGRAASWARSVVQRRSRSSTRAGSLARAVGDLPEAGPDLMVALDIDGTILHHDTTLAPRVAESVAALRETGTHVMLATGRSVFATVPVAQQLGLSTPYAISSNGAVTVRLDEDADRGFDLDHVVTFDPEPALRALRQAIPDGVFAVEDVGIGFRLSSPFPPGELSGEWELVDFEELCSREVTRLTVRAAHLDAQTFQAAVHSAGMQSVTYAIGWSSWVDVAPEGISKATALERVRDLLGVDPAATVTAGDGSNDVEMLAWAGLGVAMGGARPEVKSHARNEVAPVEQDGLADLLDLLAAPR